MSSSQTSKFVLNDPQERTVEEMKKKIQELGVEGFFFNY